MTYNLKPTTLLGPCFYFPLFLIPWLLTPRPTGRSRVVTSDVKRSTKVDDNPDNTYSLVSPVVPHVSNGTRETVKGRRKEESFSISGHD